jgi:predicted Fe-Mo cluster-binding NifX family protein
MLRILIVLVAFFLLFQPHVVGEEKIIIAVASDGETLKANVSDTAARCPYYLIVDSEGNLLEAVENPYKDARGSAGVSAANFLAGKNVTIVVAGKCGNKMNGALEAQEMTFFDFEGIAEEAIKKILEKEGST